MKIFIHPHSNINFQIKWCCPRTELLILEGLSKLPTVELVDSENKADYVIWHHVPQNGGEKSFDIINQINPKKLIVIDSIDENNEWFLPTLDPSMYFLYFKRSIIKVDNNGNREKIQLKERQYPWDYAILDGFIQSRTNKIIDIGCYLRDSCHYRKSVLDLMKFFPWKNKVVGPVSNKSRSNGEKVFFDPIYFDFVAKTSIIVSSGPFYWCGDSRGSEAVANNCLYMSNEFFNLMPNPPVHQKHWIKFNPLIYVELYNSLWSLLENHKLTTKIAKEGMEYCLKYHTSKARMEYVLQKIEENS